MNWLVSLDASTFAAIMSALATAFAAFATWRGPQAAARIADELRHSSEISNEKRRLKLNIFATIMQERATIYSVDSVRMLNSIDFVFADSSEVRETWAELYNIFNTEGIIHPQLREEKLRNLLRAMARDCGLSDTLRSDDFGRIYYPNNLAKQQELQSLQQEVQLRNLQERSGVKTNTDSFLDRFPPPPTQP